MADDKTLPVPPPFQPVMRVTYETVGTAAVAFEVDKNNVWLIAGPRAPTLREKALLERARAAVESLVAEVATTDADVKEEAEKKASGG